MARHKSHPACPYCGTAAVVVDSAVIYGRSYGLAWVCGRYPDCDAYVGCHRNSDTPLGTLANAELRKARNAAHAAFDPLWRGGKWDRSRAYAWLAKRMRLTEDECHIGMMDLEQCKQVLEICEVETAKP